MHPLKLPTNKILKYLLLVTRSFLLSAILVATFFKIPVPGTWAASVTWIGGTDSNWSTAANWSTGTVPTADDDVLIDVSGTINLAAGTTVKSLVLGNSSGTTTPILNFAHNGLVDIPGGNCVIERDFSTAHLPPCEEHEAGYDDENGVKMCADIVSITCDPPIPGTFTITGGNLHLYSGAQITHSAGTSTVVGAIKIDITSGNAIIDSGAVIDVTGMGYASSSGPGTGQSTGNGGGGGYGSSGGNGTGTSLGGVANGSITDPQNLGSGGGNGYGQNGTVLGGKGGGMVHINASGNFTNNGIIRANGTNANSTGTYLTQAAGGGSGGAVNITCNTFGGSGTISSNGGNSGYAGNSGYGGGGSGGRIAINYSSKTYTGTFESKGGIANTTGRDGGPGSIFTKATGTNGDLLYDNTGTADVFIGKGYVTFSTPQTFDNLTIRNYTTLEISSTLTITQVLNVGTNAYFRIQPAADISYGTINWIATIIDNGGAINLLAEGSDVNVPTGATYVANAPKTINNLIVNGTISTSVNTNTETNKINLNITGNLTIASTGLIDVTGKGYSSTYGPGAGQSFSNGSGGGHGSSGGDGTGASVGGIMNDSITNPQSLGSGGGNGYGQNGTMVGGSGGGAVLLTINGNLINNGVIRANGANATSTDSYLTQAAGGGAGGTINITCNTFEGNGTISANGGNSGYAGGSGWGGGGAGGRIAINYSSKTYAGTLESKGGIANTTGRDGGPGSIFTKTTGTNGDLLYDDTGTANTLVGKGYVTMSSSETFDNLTIRNYVLLDISSTLNITQTLNVGANSYLKVQSTANITEATLSWTGTIFDYGGTILLSSDSRDLTVPNGGTYILIDTSKTFRNGTVDGTITSLPNSTAETYKAVLTFTGDVQISSTGNIDVTGKGYAKGYGPGAAITAPTNAYAGGGGAYGGGGGIGTLSTFIGGSPYGSITNPQNAGSGGLGGSASSGGGIILLNVTGTLTNNGNIKSNGADGVRLTTGAGGGAGGTVNITCGTFAGNGLISSNGGNGSSSDWSHYGGGGGGGRVAVNYTSKTYTGTINARGGVANTTGRDGGAGSIYMKASGTNGDLLYDNTGTQNTLVGKGITSITTTQTFDNITVRNNSILDINSNITVTGDVSLSSNAYLRTGSSLNLSYSTFTWTLGTIIDNGGTIPLLANNVNLTVPSGSTYLANTLRTFNNVTVDGTITTSVNSTAETYKINLTANGNFTVSSTGNIDTTGLGYANGYGPGASTENPTGGNAGGGGGYGGVGGNGNVATYLGGTTYGEVANPQNAGSGGKGASGNGGSGGGIILLTVTGTLTNNGSIKSNGANGAQVTTGSGGGAGGTVNITCNELAGSGVISANGGNAAKGDWNVYGGGGGGGRIAILTNTNNYVGTFTVNGGTGTNAGGFGTIYPDTLVIANISATNVSEHSATLSTEFTTVPINGTTDTGFIWGTDSGLGTTPQSQIHYTLNDNTSSNTITDSNKFLEASFIGTGGADNNTSIHSVTGKLNSAIEFDGTQDYIDLANGFANFTNGFTITFWAYPTAVNNYARFFDCGNGSASDNIIISRHGTSTSLYLEVFRGGTAQSLIATNAIDLNAWQFFVVSQDALGNTKIYKNGNLLASGVVQTPNNITRVNNYIGKSNWADPYYKGSLDDIMIFNKSISASEVSTLYNSGTGLENYNTANSISKGSANSPKTITSDLTSLLSGTTYYFKPYAISPTGVATYGDLHSFTTLGQDIELHSITNILKDSATISSDTTSVYKTDATEKGYIFGLDPSLSTSLIHAYYFNETEGSTVIDSFGNLDGTATGTSIVTGNAGNARSFNGTSEYITLPNSTDLDFGGNDFTISTWVYFTNVSKGYQFIIDRRANSDQTGWILYLESNNALSFLSASSGGWNNTVLTSTGVVPTVNTWSNIVVTRRRDTFTMYLNGVVVKTGTFTGTIGAQTVNPTIGKNHASPGSGVQGKIDNVRIYNKGLTQEEVESFYNSGTGLENSNTISKISKGSPSNTTGTFLTTDLSELTSLTTYYFKPYILYNGIYYYGDIASFTTLADNFIPTASKDNISGVADIYAGKSLNIVTRYSDEDGIVDLDKLYLQIKNPSGTNIEYYVNASESNQTGQTPTSVSGSEYISNITYDIAAASPTSNDITVTWHLTPNWNWTRSTSIQYGVKGLDKKAAESTYDYTVATYKYENRLTFTGTVTAKDYNNNVLNSGDWTKPNSTVNFTGLRVVYAGTTDVYPNDIDFDARVTNSEASFWDDYTSVGRDISINATTVDATNSSDTYTFSIPEIPNGGQDVSNVTFIIKTDKTSPIISSLTSSTHPDSNTWYTATTATFNWTITDVDSGVQGIWYLLDNSADTTSEQVETSGTNTSSDGVTITNITNNTWYLHLIAKDNIGNTSSNVYSFKIDSGTPNIVSITGLYNNTWQNIDAGPIISWTDPSSISDDTFYITNDGTVPTPTNYTYTTTSNTYDLPNQSEGQTTITVRALNGAGVYSISRTFLVNYDNTVPVISSLTSTTHPDSNTWYTTTTATLEWDISETYSGIQNTWYLLDNNFDTTNADVMTNGIEISNDTITIAGLTSNTWYFHLTTKDNAGNTSSSVYSFKIDSPVPNIVQVTGLYNNVWQNIDAGPVISWTNPSSISEDTFYITNDGTTPTSTNYTYTTTSNTYDLPNQTEGQTTITVRALNGAGIYSISRTFLVNYDNTVPVISSLTSSTHPDSEIWYTTTTANLSWTISETYSGIQNTWYLLNNNSSSTNEEVMNDGTEISNSSITIAGITSNTWYFHLTTKDNAGNISSSVYSFKIDSPVPNIVEVTGLYNNVWQSEDAGPVISWTDPNSTSGDTFYITNDGTTPTSTNYTYTTTSNTYDLPSQTEGQTTITVRDLNGAGVYSVSRTFIVKYDNTAPVISSLTSSTHPDSNVWYDNNIATINWTINDSQSGIYKVWRLVDQTENTTATQVMDNGTEDQAIDNTQITLATDGTWYFHIVAIDNKGISTIGTFKINVDTQAPSSITVSSTTHPNQVAWYSNNVAEIAWNFTDTGSGVEGVWRLLTQDITKTSNEILNNGTQALANTSWTTAALTDGVWHLHLTAKDNMGNTLSTKYTLQIDSSTPDIAGITGANNNVLQNTESGPMISWTDPNSISGDTFYITNDGTTPTSSNYTYTTTSNTYDLPNQKQGETTINVRALNGAGTYSDTKAFIIKYDSLAPANVSNFVSSATTNTVTLSWINPTASDFSRVILIKNTDHIPTSLTDGTKIYEGTNTTHVDTNLNEGTKYYYTIYTFDTIENMSSGAITQITTNTTPVVTPPSTPQTQTPTTPVVTPTTPVVTEPIVPPITNNTKVVKSQDLVEEKKLNITVDSKQAIETRIGDLHVYPEQIIQIEIPAKTIKDEVSDIRQVVLTLDNEAYNLTYNSESDTYRTTISAPSIKGAYDTTIATISTDENNSFTITMSLLVDPYGYVYSVSSNGGENRILNAKVSLYTKKDGLEILLRTTDGTNNPQYTDIQGEYQFFVAPGEYKLVVEAQGYIPTETEWFTVDKNIIEKNIEIKKNPYLLYCGIAIVEIAAGFFLFILQRKKRKNRKRYAKPI